MRADPKNGDDEGLRDHRGRANADWPVDFLNRAKADGIYLGFKSPEQAAVVMASADALLVVMSFEKKREFSCARVSPRDLGLCRIWKPGDSLGTVLARPFVWRGNTAAPSS